MNVEVRTCGLPPLLRGNFHFSLQFLFCVWKSLPVTSEDNDVILPPKWNYLNSMDKSRPNTMLLHYSVHFDSCWVRILFASSYLKWIYKKKFFVCRFLWIFGSIQLYMYKRYATPITDTYGNLPKSTLYNIQIFLLLFIPFNASVRFFLTTAYFHNPVYGYMVSLILHLINLQLMIKKRFSVDFKCHLNMHHVPTLCCSLEQRAPLPFTITSNKRAWLSSFTILDNDFYHRKSGIYQYAPRRMVV